MTEARSFTTKTTNRPAAEQFARGLVPYAIAATVVLIAAGLLAFYYAPNEADQGFRQKIFYLHVPMAIVTLGGFVAGGVMAIQYLRTEDPSWDLRSYVAIHLSLILGVGVLITGAIWAKTSWGTWWEWKEPTLVSFLIVFLLYAVYQPMRFSIDDPGRQARYAAVYAVICGAFVPLNFLAVRLAEPLIHPRVLGTTAGGLTGEMQVAFYTALAGFILLYIALWKFELTAKSISMQLSKLKAEQNP
ncbi:MAG TPA: cytochrome c biogenesis protein CcsA [Solirubrobacterales bacterium]|jgi:heme exporter protein C|nr:cytochrome c biogenesis protein CcsA [Solirubrobacterales bacterium]